MFLVSFPSPGGAKRSGVFHSVSKPIHPLQLHTEKGRRTVVRGVIKVRELEKEVQNLPRLHGSPYLKTTCFIYEAPMKEQQKQCERFERPDNRFVRSSLKPYEKSLRATFTLTVALKALSKSISSSFQILITLKTKHTTLLHIIL